MNVDRRWRALVSGVVAAVTGTALAVGSLVALGGGAQAASSDAPNSRTAARTAGAKPIGTWLTETIGSRTDSDWYRFDVTTAGYVTATLGGLPADYSLGLYDNAGKELATSVHSARQFERVLKRVNPGSYYLRVSTAGAYSSSKKYSLRFLTPKPGVTTLTSTIRIVDPSVFGPLFSGSIEFFNNTAQWQMITGWELTYYDRNGVVLNPDGSSSGLGDRPVIRPAAVLPVRLDPTTVPPATTRVRIVPTATALSDKGNNGVSLKVARSSTWGQLTEYNFDVTVTNASSHARRVNTYVSAYNSMGSIVEAGERFAALKPKSAQRWVAYLDDMFPNRIVSSVVGVSPVPEPAQD